ncbi:MAG: hypothetical protein WC749_06610 [Dehalococcoidia bacterium]
MTSLLQDAFEKASKLPADLQDQIAQTLLVEITWEEQWDETLLNSQDLLERMANHAISEFEAGKTHEKGFDEL